MTRNEFNINYWMFYLQLEKEFYNTLDYVEFSQDNYETFSKQYVRQLLSIGSELDVVFKALCKVVNPNASAGCITDYANILCNWGDLVKSEVQFKFTKEFFKPFEGWEPNKSPDWWRDYNTVKHNRADANNLKKGNLKNVFYALMALFDLNRNLCKEVSGSTALNEPEIKSSLFEMKGWDVCIPEGNGSVRILRTDGSMDFCWE